MPLASGFFYFPSTACSAWPIVLTRISSRLSRPVSLSVFCQGYHTFMEAQALHFTQALPNALHTAQLTRQAHFTDSRQIAAHRVHPDNWTPVQS